MTALKYWDGSNWVTIGSIPGQAGVLATQRKTGALAEARANFTTDQVRFYDRASGGLPIEITYTPAVDCYWEVTGHVGQLQKIDAAYHYGGVRLNITPADADGITLAQHSIETQHSGVQQLMAHNVKYTFRLKAGVTYTAFMDLVIGGGSTFTYACGPTYLTIEGKSWPLLSNTPPPALAGSTPLLDVLPSTPVNGQEIYYQNAAMLADGVMWHLRYNANTPGAYKWSFIGGGWMRHYVSASENRNASGTMAFADLPTIGPQIAVPLAGDYDLDWGFRYGYHSAVAGASIQMALDGCGGTAGVGSRVDAAILAVDVANVGVGPARMRKVETLTVGTLKALYWTSGGSGTGWYIGRYLHAQPVRVG